MKNGVILWSYPILVNDWIKGGRQYITHDPDEWTSGPYGQNPYKVHINALYFLISTVFSHHLGHYFYQNIKCKQSFG